MCTKTWEDRLVSLKVEMKNKNKKNLNRKFYRKYSSKVEMSCETFFVPPHLTSD